MNEEVKLKEKFFEQLWLEFSKGSASEKLGIVSSLFTILGVSGVYFYSNLSLGKILDLNLFQLSVLFLLTTLLMVFSLLIIGGMIFASNPKNFDLKISFLYLIVIILVWGIGLSGMLLIFSLYMELVGIIFN
ncbi:UNVERIFIED_CONTAM: putative membrane protein [Paenibacillus sp. PvR008]